MQRPALLLIAHGSRDPRHASTMRELLLEVSARLPSVRVSLAFLDFNGPSVPSALSWLAASGVREVVAAPLLLTQAFHAKTDIPAALSSAPPSLRVHQAPVLGPSPLLLSALNRRLEEAGVHPAHRATTGIVLAAAGSTDPEAIAGIAHVAREWRRTTGWCAVRPAFASAALPTPADAIRALRADGVRRVAVAPYALAPGRLPDRIAAGASGADALAPVLGAAGEVGRVVVERYNLMNSATSAT